MARASYRNPDQNLDAYATGDNLDGSRTVFIERQKYDQEIFPDNLIPNFVQTWSTERFYGTISNKGNPVIADPRQLKSLWFGTGDTLYALGFVADAWRDFATKLEEMTNSNQLYENSVWARVRAAKAWTSIPFQYEEYMLKTVFPGFNQQYLAVPGRANKIRDIHTFLTIFDDFVEEALSQAGPLSLSGFVESSYLTPLASGLMIEVDTGVDYDDDYMKSYAYKDDNFQLVARIAAQYGFSIDKNIPWRFVADIRNPAMREYMYGVPIEGFIIDNTPVETCEPYFGDPELAPMAFGYSQVPGMEDVIRHVNVYFTEDHTPAPGYQQYQEIREATQQRAFEILYSMSYTETWMQDPEDLARYIVGFYNALVEQQPVITMRDSFMNNGRAEECPTLVFEREQISLEEFMELYGERWKLKTMYVSRIMERGYEKTPRQRARDLQRVFNIYNLSDEADAYDRAVRYIQEEYIGPTDQGSLTLSTIGDILGLDTTGQRSDLSNAGRQDGMRRDLRGY